MQDVAFRCQVSTLILPHAAQLIKPGTSQSIFSVTYWFRFDNREQILFAKCLPIHQSDYLLKVDSTDVRFILSMKTHHGAANVRAIEGSASLTVSAEKVLVLSSTKLPMTIAPHPHTEICSKISRGLGPPLMETCAVALEIRSMELRAAQTSLITEATAAEGFLILDLAALIPQEVALSEIHSKRPRYADSNQNGDFRCDNILDSNPTTIRVAERPPPDSHGLDFLTSRSRRNGVSGNSIDDFTNPQCKQQ
mgnify:CR=1 FL=1